MKNSGEVPQTPCARRQGCLCLLILPLVSLSADAVGNSESGASSELPCSRSSKYQSGRLRTARLQVRVLPGAPISRACGSTRIAEGPDSESGSLGGASPGSPTGVWLTGNSRPVRLKPEQPWECKSPHADQPSLRASARQANFGMPTGRASRACLLNSACLRASGASPRHSASFDL